MSSISNNEDALFDICLECGKTVVNGNCACTYKLTLTEEEFNSLCITDQNKVKEILRKLEKKNGTAL